MDMSVAIIPIVGMAIPIILVPVAARLEARPDRASARTCRTDEGPGARADSAERRAVLGSRTDQRGLRRGRSGGRLLLRLNREP